MSLNVVPLPRCHAYVKFAPAGVQLPASSVRRELSAGWPAIDGAPVFTGGADCTTAVAPLVAVTLPSGLAPVTFTRTRAATSDAPSVYVGLVAPAMSAKPVPASRCHWKL